MLGTLLLVTRLAELGKSFWFDESFFVAHYVREGPRGIIAGTGLSHEPYGLLAWATGELVGESYMTPANGATSKSIPSVGAAHASRSALARAATVASYSVLACALLWSRLAHLGHSFWTDEILMVHAYVDAGPRFILTGPDLSHELMALADWATSRVTGQSETAFRLWSAIPFVAGVAVVTAWLHRRADALSGVLFLFLATVSPLLLDISRQARGYGLAFFAMCVMVAAALEAVETKNARLLVAVCAAGVVGTWTLPQVGIAFVAIGATLVLVPGLARSTLWGMAPSLVAIVAWYSPHLTAVQESAKVADGTHLALPWVLTSPIDQILLPGLLWLDGTIVLSGIVWLPLVLLAVLVATASPLLRDARTALVVCAAPVATPIVLWAANATIIPRYLSYLLVPLFILVATGASWALRSLNRPRAIPAAVTSLVVVGYLAISFVTLAPAVVGLPREANRDAAEVITRRTPATPVVAYMRNPQNLAFYLGRPFEAPKRARLAVELCSRKTPVFFVFHDFGLKPVDISCLSRAGVHHEHLREYTRGEMNVWLIPPRR
jgi:hypothetical protein